MYDLLEISGRARDTRMRLGSEERDITICTQEKKGIRRSKKSLGVLGRFKKGKGEISVS